MSIPKFHQENKNNQDEEDWMTTEQKQYIKELRHFFPVYGSAERRFYTDIKGSITDYLESNPQALRDDLIREFGVPSQIVFDYFSNIESDQLLKKLKRSRYIRTACFAIVSAFCVFAVVGLITWRIAYMNYTNSKINSTETTIEPIEK